MFLRHRRLVAYFIITTAAACGDLISPPLPVASINISRDSATLVPGATLSLSATPLDAQKKPLTRDITWASSAPAVASVIAGNVIALAPGNALITASSGPASVSAAIIVKEGAIVGPAGARISAAGGQAIISVPAGAAAAPTQLTVEAVSGVPASPRLVAGTAFRFDAGGSQLGSPVSITLRYDPAKHTAGAIETGLKMYQLVDGAWKRVTGSTVDVTGKTVTATVSALGVYGILEQAPATASPLRGNAQSATARTAVSVPPAITVVDSEGFPVPDIAVHFAVVSGGGNVTGASVKSGGDGVAALGTWTLGTKAGPNTLTATVTGAAGGPFTFTATAVAGAPATLSINGGDAQTTIAGSAVSTPPSVIVYDADQNRVSGATVTFAPSGQSGSVTAGTATTDSSGIATIGSWITSPVAGTNTLSASIASLPGVSVIFKATGVAGPAAQMTLLSGNGQTAPAGRPLLEDVVFRVLDKNGNPVPNANVNFTVTSGGGRVTPSTAISLSTGVVFFDSWTLGPATGDQSVTAAVSGTTGVSTTVTARAATIRIVTFGDSNTDYGYKGNDPTLNAVSYVSANVNRPSPSMPNNATQLAGKIENLWMTAYSPAIVAVNHGILGTTSGTPRATAGSPGALTLVNGFTRFDAEVMGRGYPWNGGEPQNSNYPLGPVTRVLAFTPAKYDFAYMSFGTNDSGFGISVTQTIQNLASMIDIWESAGLPVDHLIITTLPPIFGSVPEIQVERNRAIRGLAAQRGVKLVDISAFTSDDDGLTWKRPSLHVGDGTHYAEEVRDWIAARVLEIMAAGTLRRVSP